METRATLADDTLEALQEMIHVLHETQNTMIEAAGQSPDADVARLLYRIAGERAQMEDELATYMRLNDRSVLSASTSLNDDLGMLWQRMRSFLRRSDSYAVLGEVHRTDQLILNRLKRLIVQLECSAVNDVLHRHFLVIKQGHTAIAALREKIRLSRRKL